MRAGFSLISGIIFLALAIAATGIVYQAGVPLIQDLQAGAAVDRMKVTLSDLDAVIREVAAEGRGSTRTVYITADPGILTVNGSTDTITWELETDAAAVSPRTSQRFGNLVVGSNLESSVTEADFNRSSPAAAAYVLENSRLAVYVKKVGSATNSSAIRTDDLVLGIYNKELGSWLDNAGFLDITIDDNEASRSGVGYTLPPATGSNLPAAVVKAYMDTTYVDYTLTFSLESGADFLTIEGGEGIA
ncbi:MAG: hypothetical protein HY520_00415 [Candidatus Aenigmarchaeota archaeon]|nr:hypothetical protein [Candidatus Aenigmarchaeota archaeon]